MDVVATLKGLAKALIEVEEGVFGVNKTTGSEVSANYDAAIRTVVNAVSGFEHGAEFRKCCIVRNRPI